MTTEINAYASALLTETEQNPAYQEFKASLEKSDFLTNQLEKSRIGMKLYFKRVALGISLTCALLIGLRIAIPAYIIRNAENQAKAIITTAQTAKEQKGQEVKNYQNTIASLQQQKASLENEVNQLKNTVSSQTSQTKDVETIPVNQQDTILIAQNIDTILKQINEKDFCLGSWNDGYQTTINRENVQFVLNKFLTLLNSLKEVEKVQNKEIARLQFSTFCLQRQDKIDLKYDSGNFYIGTNKLLQPFLDMINQKADIDTIINAFRLQRGPLLSQEDLTNKTDAEMEKMLKDSGLL